MTLRCKRLVAAGAVLAIGATSIAPASAQPATDEDVEVQADPAKAPALAQASAGPTAEDWQAVKEELERLRARVDELEAERATAPGEAEARPTTKDAETKPHSWFESLLGVSAVDVSAYVQAQYEWHEDSEDQLAQGGEPLNQDRFLIRRGRIRLDAAWEWSAFSIELDGNTTHGPSFGLRRAHGSVLWRGPWGPEPTDLAALLGDGPPPLMMLTVGLQDIPFGQEVGTSAAKRVFMERSAGSLAFFPGEPDLGARLSGGVAFFRYALAVFNGEPLDERNAVSSRDPNEAKDFVGRLGVDVEAHDIVRVDGGISALRGEGFHAGNDGTKDDVQWRDTNENGLIDPGELIAAPGSAPTPSEGFGRWAIGADLRVRIDTPIGATTVYGEVAVAQNLDRGFFVADPILTGIDVRELSVFGAVVQELTPYAFVGLRVDLYDPNADFFDSRGGKLLPTSQAVRTISPVAGGGIPDVFRLVVQYDNVHDALTRDEVGVPADLANDRFTARLQVSL